MRSFRGKSAVALAVLATLAVAFARHWAESHFGSRPFYVLFLLPVTACAFLGGFAGGAAAALTAGAAIAVDRFDSLGAAIAARPGEHVRWLVPAGVLLIVAAGVEWVRARVRSASALRDAAAAPRPEQLMRIALITGMLGTLGVAVFAVLSLLSVSRDARRAERLHDAAIAARLLESRIGALQSLAVGIEASGDRALAAAYPAAAARVARETAALGQTFADVPAEAPVIENIVVLVRAALTANEAVAARGQGESSTGPVRSLPVSDGSHATAARSALDQLAGRVDALAAGRRSAIRRSERILVAAVAVIGGGSVVFGLLAWARSRRGFARARAAEADLAKAAEELEQRIAQRTAELAESNELLRKREALLSTVTNSANVGLVVIDAEHRFRYANRAYGLSVGIRPEDVVGRHIRDVRGDQYETEIRPHLERCLAGEVVAFETTLGTQSGGREARHFAIVQAPDRDDNDGRLAVVVLVDVTDQRRAERSLRESRRLYETLVQQMPVGFFRKDLAGRYVFVNSAFAHIAGAAPEDLLGRTSEEFARERRAASPDAFLPEWEGNFVAGGRHHREIVGTGRILAQEEELIAPDGERRSFHSIKIPVRNEEGGLVGSQGIMIDVTERRRAEEAVRASELRVRLATEAAAIGFWESDLRTGRITWSDRETELMGFAPGEFSGTVADFVALIHPDDRAKFRAAKQRAIEGPGDYAVELRFVRRDGSVRWGLVRGRVERDKAGEPVRFVGVEIDITAQKLSELEVRAERHKLALFVEHAPAAIAMLDRDLGYLSVSRRWAAEFAPGIPDLVGRRPLDHLPDSYGLWHARYQRALAGETVRVDAERMVRPDGTARWLHWEIHPWTNESGGIGGIVVLGEDITSRRTAEQALETERTLLRTIFDVLPESIYVKDGESRFLMANAACAADMRVPSSADLLGRTDADFFDADLARRFREKELTVLAGEELRDQADVFPGDDSDLRHRINNVVPLRTREGAIYGLVGTSRDVTAAKRAEQEIRDLNARLEQRVLERTAELEAANQELEAFSYSVSHDLRAPLRAIDGFSQIVEEDYAELLPAEGRRRLGTIRGEAQRMGRLIDDLLAFSRLGRGPVEVAPVDMDALVRECTVSLAQESAGRELTWQIDPLPPARGNARLLRQVWFNLIANALKYTRKRSQATIRISSRTDAAGAPVYFVQDDGVGFDMRYAGKLFGVFQRLHRADEFEGTGAGLAIARRIVQRHFGRIWAESSPGLGATFHFTLFEPDYHERNAAS